MGLNKQKGDMYPWVDYTWNPIRGKCMHDCVYCYMKNLPWYKPENPVHLVKEELRTNLGRGRVIFVGSGCDMFAHDVRSKWIYWVLEHCRKFNDNSYLLQTKNPMRFKDFHVPDKTIYATTIESNRDYPDYSNAPSVNNRYIFMKQLKTNKPKIVSIEPVLDFDVDIFASWIEEIDPDFVSIGADSKHHGLPEPNAEKLAELIVVLKDFTEVKIKKNLSRIKVEE